MAKKSTEISIPLPLAKLLASEPDDMKNSEEYENVQSVAKVCLRLLLKI